MTGPGPRSDPELVTAHLGRDPQAFNELVRRHRQQLWAIAVQILREPGDAADAVQSGVLRGFRSAHTYSGDVTVLAWLEAIVRDSCVKYAAARWQQTATPPAPSDDDETPTPAGVDGSRDRRERLHDALHGLPSEDRQSFLLVTRDGLSYAEAAAVEQTDVETVRSRVAQVRAALARRRGSQGLPRS